MNQIERIDVGHDKHPYLMLVQSLNREIQTLEENGASIDWKVIDDQLGANFTTLLPDEANPNQPSIPIAGFRNFNSFVGRLAQELTSIFYQSQDVFTANLSRIFIDSDVPTNPTIRQVDSMLSTDNPEEVIKLLKLAGIVLPIANRENAATNSSPFKIPQAAIAANEQAILSLLKKE